MELTRVWRRALAAVRTAAAIAAAVACVAGTLAPALAGTTGVIRGTVTDTSGAPLAGVSVTFAAPSGTYKASTDAKGFYAVAGVYADTYTGSFVKAGYDTSEITGVTVFADQAETVNTKLAKSLKTIAKVTARSVASAFQPQQTVDTYTVNAQQVENLQGTDLNISESNLLTSLPGVGYDSSGYPVIHGGRENEEGFQFEGIPYTDAFTNQFVSSLALPGSGIASAQLTPGVGDASVQSGGTGVINLVAKRGTYPGATDAEFRVGGPGFDHVFNGDLSFASPNGTYSDYAAFSGGNSAPRFGTGTNSAQEGWFFQTGLQTDREFLNNFIFRFGKTHNQAIQLFADVAQHQFFQDAGGLGGLCFQSCNPYFQNFYGPIFGLSNAQLSAITPLYPNQTSSTETLAQAGRAAQTYYQPNETFKIGYDWNINPSTFLSADFYSVNSVVTFDFPTAGTNPLGYGDFFLEQGGHSLGGSIKLQKQLNAKNLVQAGYEFRWLHPEYAFNGSGYNFLAYLINSPTVFTPLDFVNPNDPNCPFGPGACGYAYGASPGAAQMTVPFATQNSDLNRRDTSFYLNDKIEVNDKLNLQLGVRYEKADFVGLPTPGLQSDCTFLYNPASAPANPNYNANNPIGPGNCPFTPNFSNITNAMIHPSELEPRIGLAWQLNPNTAIRFTYDRATAFPLLGLVDDRWSLNGYGQFAKLAPFSLLNALLGVPNSAAIPTINGQSATNVTSCGIAPYQVACPNYASELYWASQNLFGVPYQPVLPMVSNNYQITFQHQFTKGALNGVAISIAPWLRHQTNTEATVAQPLLGSNGLPVIKNGQVIFGPASATNLGKEFGDGIDVNITRESRTGLSAQWTMTYVNEFSSVLPTTAGEDFFPSIPYASVLAGNQYRVGFLSPFQTTLGLTYRTKNGWRINPRFSYDVGYPVGNGTLTAAIINGVAVNIPNTNVLPGGAAQSSGLGAGSYVDPLNPGSVFNPNVIASRGNSETSSPGGKLTKPNFLANVTVEYSPPKGNYKLGFDVENIFNKYYAPNGTFLNDRYQPIATGIAGPLTGSSYQPTDYQVPFANPQYASAYGGNGVFANFPNSQGRAYYFYYSVRI
ncbi:MAG: TonB-dependent receptor [bacterium]|nr:TonB-dependent receptor [bacterium]